MLIRQGYQVTYRVHKVVHQQDLFPVAARNFCQIFEESITSKGLMTVALAGGSTPKSLYELLAKEPYRSRIDWPKLHFFWGDERHVPPSHHDSNYRMAQEALLSKVPVNPEHVYRMKGEVPQASDAADAYEQSLRNVFSPAPGEVPVFDLILLGMGADGHTASLFPGTKAVHESSRWVAAPWVEKLETYRITLTPVVVNQARHIMFLISGKDKASALKAVLEGPRQPDQYPSQIVKPVSGELVWLIDDGAASLLEGTRFESQ